MTRTNLLHVMTSTNPDEIPADRLNGTSTALAYKYISEAILNKDTRIVVKDHIDRNYLNRYLAYRIRAVVKHNKLLGFIEGKDTNGNFWIMCSLKMPTTGD